MQLEHDERPAAENLPAVQLKQDVAPVVATYLPETQLEHADEPVVARKVPTAHFEQVVADDATE